MPSENRSLDWWLDYISSTHPSEIEMGLDRIKTVFSRLDFKLKPTQVVTVAGTNGKGSTIAMCEAALSALGYKTGSYTSPHIVNFNERIRIAGIDVSDKELVCAFEVIEQARSDIKLTYFEFSTLAAFYLLFNAGLDVALLEVGLGGRLDAVNIVDPDISIITSIDFDHQEWLGNDLETIGIEKAGILRASSIFLAGEDLPSSVFRCAKQLGCSSMVCHQDFGYEVLEDSAKYYCKTALSHSSESAFDCVIDNVLPRNNIALALQAAVVCVTKLTGVEPRRDELERIRSSIEQVGVPGRLEKVQGFNVLLDVGHNPHAARFLAEYVARMRDEGVMVDAVYSALGDKDVEQVVKSIAPCVDAWRVAPLNLNRAMNIEELLEKVRKYADNVQAFKSVADALDSWMCDNSQHFPTQDNAFDTLSMGKEQNRLLLVFGSFYTVEAAKQYFEKYD